MVEPGPEEIHRRKDPIVIGFVEPCRCGQDELEVVPEGYKIVGMFGIHMTNKNLWTKRKYRFLDNIRALGFVYFKC